ncbi:MAG: phage tail sheath subtilisin-like domain-containing protein [Cyanobacteria bacterium P01_F01_bin.150]
MPTAYKTPGVYRQDIFVRPRTQLPTGVPGFVGFFETLDPSKNDLFPVNVPIFLHRKEEFTNQFKALGFLQDAVVGFFENGGTRCYVVRADATQSFVTSLSAAVEALAPMTDLDLVAVPDAVLTATPSEAERQVAIQVQRLALAHCARHGDRFAILDALPGSTPDDVINQLDLLRIGQAEPLNGALYYPWINNSNQALIPAAGHIAGIYARSDRNRGVFKAPANEVIQDSLDLEIVMDNTMQDQLNPQGINCLRSFPRRGIRVWGARTLSQDPSWRYINVRRLVLTLGRWIDRNMNWATFEPNSPQLWVRIQRELNAYLRSLWQAGALKGAIPEQSFYVKCDGETNPVEVREMGQVITEIGLAAIAPAEFLVVRLIHRPGNTEIDV